MFIGCNMTVIKKKSVVRKYIKEQSGFMHDHLSRIILDMIDYIHFIEDDSFVLFIDFYKAFDTAIHDCLVLEICF